MTNAEKFKEVFGIPMDDELEITGSICTIIDCSQFESCSQCPIDKEGLVDYDFWEREYEIKNEDREIRQTTERVEYGYDGNVYRMSISNGSEFARYAKEQFGYETSLEPSSNPDTFEKLFDSELEKAVEE